MGKRIFLAAAWLGLLASAGCLERMCERHGYYKAAAAPAYAPACCVPCQPAAVPAAGYVAPSSSWTAPAATAGTCPPGYVPACVPANH